MSEEQPADAAHGKDATGNPSAAESGDGQAPRAKEESEGSEAEVHAPSGGKIVGSQVSATDRLDLGIIEPHEAHWAARSVEERRAYIDEVKKYHFKEIGECAKQANLCVEAHRHLATKNQT